MQRPTTLSAKRTQSSTTISQTPGADLPVIGSDYLPSPSVLGDLEVSSTSSKAHGSLATGFPPDMPTEGVRRFSRSVDFSVCLPVLFLKIDSLFGSNLSIPSGAVEPFDFDLYMSFPGDGSAHSTSFADTKLQDAFEPSAFD